VPVGWPAHRTITAALLAGPALLGGCVAAAQHRQEMLHQTVTVLNESQIMVMTGDLSLPHRLLGEIRYSEPLSAEAIDTSHIDRRLRSIAIERYQDRVDAITHLTSGPSGDGSIFEVSAQAVEVIGPCAFCRHKEVLRVDEPNPAQREVAAPMLAIGDTWVVRLEGADGASTDGAIKVTGVSGKRVTINWFGHRNLYTADGNLIAGHVGLIEGSFDPDLGTFDFPLWPGKKWSKDWMLKTDQGRIAGTTHGQALGWEKVTVPAGTLDALKVEIEYRTGLSDVKMSCWYAPEVAALAKCDTTDPDFKSQELVSYRPAGAGVSH